MALLLGIDVGSSSIKVTVLDPASGAPIGSATSPATELAIHAPRPGWAEQDPATWWEHTVKVVRRVLADPALDATAVKAVGLSYQMHGLVLVDRNRQVLRPAIIWCDSRAVETGERAFREIGPQTCLERLLNSPGNFTASKLKWVMENEPDIASRVDRIMLPGDYVAMRMTDRIVTTPSGLSEGILWDFRSNGTADLLLDHYGISKEVLPELVPTFGVQGELTAAAAGELGLEPGTPVSYRAGDQPNNALSLNVLRPGEVATTAGTSGVVYGVTDRPDYDPESRVNTFVHVNHTAEHPRYGVLLCVNGAGILNSWVKREVLQELEYDAMNELAAQAPVGAEGLVILPYGNGAERTLGNRDVGSAMRGLNFNVHGRAHVARAAQEAVVFALNYGLEIMRGVGVKPETVRAGHANMFLSPLFTEAFATVSGARLELFNTDGSQGAARAAGVGAGIYATLDEAFEGLQAIRVVEPNADLQPAYRDACQRWRGVLEEVLGERDGR